MTDKTNERIDVVNDDVTLIQYTDGLTFGTDALLLAGYVREGYASGIEQGSGSGIISLLLLTRGKVKHITAIEVQDKYARLTKRNAELNSLSDRLNVMCADLREVRAEAKHDIVVANPPYMKNDGGKRNDVDAKNIARHEVCGNIGDFVAFAKRALKYGGAYYCVYRPDRMMDLLSSMREEGLEPKWLTAVYANVGSEPSMILVEGKKGAKCSLKFTKPLIIYKDASNKEYTDDMNYIMEHGAFPPEYRL